jgi:uncharacterized RDD family membrane protein YckC
MEPAPYLSRRRGFAWIVDGLVVVGISGLGATVAFHFADPGRNPWDWLATVPGVAAMLTVGWLYLGLLTSSSGSRCGQTLGKWLVGLAVMRADGRSPGRGRLLGRAACDMATMAVFLVVAQTSDEGPRGADWIVVLLLTPCLLAAWVIRDRLLDVRLTRAPGAFTARTRRSLPGPRP